LSLLSPSFPSPDCLQKEGYLAGWRRISPVIVFVGLFVWGFLLGGIGAILAAPLTLLVLIIMENSEGTRAVALLMRYTGDMDNADQKKALENVKGWWNKTRHAISPDKEHPSEG
jgi:hypothetical protein